MEYRNKKTGFTFFSSCKVKGKDWEEVSPDDKIEGSAKTDEVPNAPPDEESVDDNGSGDEELDNITVKEIKQELDAMGIEYDPKLKKQELYDLMMGQGE